MIQRIQSLWLLLSAVAIAMLFKLPVYGGVLGTGEAKNLLVGQNYLLFIVAAVLVLFPAMAIALFKNRSNQKKLIWLTVLINIVFIGLIWMEVGDFTQANPNFTSSVYKVGAILPIVSIVLLVLAYAGIRKDEKLIASADRLR